MSLSSIVQLPVGEKLFAAVFRSVLTSMGVLALVLSLGQVVTLSFIHKSNLATLFFIGVMWRVSPIMVRLSVWAAREKEIFLTEWLRQNFEAEIVETRPAKHLPYIF